MIGAVKLKKIKVLQAAFATNQYILTGCNLWYLGSSEATLTQVGSLRAAA
jgi:hypothetical protein